jgi:hypothetical protein
VEAKCKSAPPVRLPGPHAWSLMVLQRTAVRLPARVCTLARRCPTAVRTRTRALGSCSDCRSAFTQYSRGLCAR